MLDQVLLILACVCFAAAALRVKSPVDLGWLGLLFFAVRGLVS